MSSKEFHCYIGLDKKESLEVIREVLTMIQEQNYTCLIEKYPKTACLLVGFSSSSEIGKEEILDEMEEVLDFSYSEEILRNSVCFSFDTSTSLEEDSFMEFFVEIGVKRIETKIYHSGCDETYYMLNDEFLDDSESVDFKWLIDK